MFTIECNYIFPLGFNQQGIPPDLSNNRKENLSVPYLKVGGKYDDKRGERQLERYYIVGQ